MNITNKIIDARKAVKRKLEALKQHELQIEKSFAPITAPLHSIAKHINLEMNENLNIKKKSEPLKEEEENINIEPTIDSEEVVQSDTEYLEKFSDLPKTYISGMIHDTKNKHDFKYGVRYNPEEDAYYIGNSEIQFDGDNLIINNNEYRGTPGLYELLFKKHAHNFNNDDKKQYINIVKNTSAHKRNYNSLGQISGSRCWKYTHIIKPMIQKPRIRYTTGKVSGGELMMQVSDNPIDYVYWDDPNELVDRLRLLIASRAAGNSNHTNEINRILEELLESKIIEPLN